MPRRGLIEEPLTQSAIGAFYEVYNFLGFGFLENTYANALERELSARGHSVSREVRFPISYKAELVGYQRLDMIVDSRLIVEVKSTASLAPGARRQLYNYLKASDLTVGLLMHFGPKPRFYRMVANDFSVLLENAD